MAQFTFDQYQKAVSAAQNKGTSVKVGWFKLADDGDEALVRLNVSKVDDLQFATIHQLGASTKWMKVSCLNQIGSFEDNCPLCKAIAAGNTSIGKASKRVYIQMLVSYKDKLTGQFSAPVPVIWDKPAGFSREIANKLSACGDLKQVMFKIVRNGAKNNMQTTYSMDLIPPTNPVLRPEMIPADFSAFDNFRLDKHSFWVKTAEEINTFLTTGSFPEVQKAESNTTNQVVAESAPEVKPAAPAYASQPAPTAAPTYSQPAQPTYSAPVQPTAAPETKKFSF